MVSALKGFFTIISLLIKVKPMLSIGISIISIGIAREIIVNRLIDISIATTAKVRPKNRLPESPKNNFAG